jgi:hypothetical protein
MAARMEGIPVNMFLDIGWIWSVDGENPFSIISGLAQTMS